MLRVDHAVAEAFEPVVPDLRLDIYRGEEWTTQFASDVRAGLTLDPMSLPSKYFYDSRGSQLFDEITELPEYYQCRAERSILDRYGAEIIAQVAPTELVELGSGSSVKTEALLDHLTATVTGCCYTPIDVSESAVRTAAVRLVDRYRGMRVHGLIGDFERHLGGLPDSDASRLFVFLGGTIGNFTPQQTHVFLRRMGNLLNSVDHLLIGVDLVKDQAVLEAAYDDSKGVTAQFNKNILRTVNDNLGGNFDLDNFDHVAFFDHENAWIEMRLRSNIDQLVRVSGIDLDLAIDRGTEIRTEISRKFTRESFTADLKAANFDLRQWYTDHDERFALALAQPSSIFR